MSFPRDSHILATGDVRRLSAQNQRVLARLQRGPATRHELQAIASNITARISDLREAGYDIPTPVHSLYRLKKRSEEVPTPVTGEADASVRASVPSDVGERQDLRACNETAPRDVHDLNLWELR